MILAAKKRPPGITAVSTFFGAGSVICLVASLSLLRNKNNLTHGPSAGHGFIGFSNIGEGKGVLSKELHLPGANQFKKRPDTPRNL